MRDEFAPENLKEAPSETTIAQVHEIARSISSGRVLAYGDVGAKCEPPVSGYICGRIMNNAMDDVPWWRVVAKDGSLPIAKRNLNLAQRQRDLLQGEGIQFDDKGRVKMNEFRAS